MKTMKECVREYVKANNNTVTSQEVINYILEEKKFKIKKRSITDALRTVLKEVGGSLKPYGLKEEILNYVRAHNNAVTSQEVINYILEEKKMGNSVGSIRTALGKVLQEVGGTLKPYGVKAEIRNYVKNHNNTVTSQEVINYILEEKKMKIRETNIIRVLRDVLKEEGGTLKSTYGELTAEIYNYVKIHNNEVTSQKVINYILEEKKMKTSEKCIRSALIKVLKKAGGTLKPYGLKEEIRNYVKIHNNTVTSQEVIKYILEEKKIETTNNSIKATLRTVLKEAGGTLKSTHGELKAEICNYVKTHNNTVSSQEVIDYILEEKKMKNTKNSIVKTLEYVLKEVGGSYIKNNCN